MRKKTSKWKILFFLLLLMAPFAHTVKAQWVVHDPGNFAQLVSSYGKQLLTANNTFDNLQEAQKIFQQGKKYYDSLREVHHLVKNARKVQTGISLSVKVIEEYNKTYSSIASDTHFTSKQLDVYRRQQSGIMEEIASVIDDLTKVITNTGMSMSDKERLDAIDRLYEEIVALHTEARGVNMQMLGESMAVKTRKESVRLERELLR